MGFKQGHVPAHKGETVTEEPIRTVEAIQQIKANLRDRSIRDYALFVVGINTAFRCGDLVSITVGDVRGKKAGDDILIREEKTNKLRRVTLNEQSANAISMLLRTDPECSDHDFLFRGQRGQLSVSYVNRLVKRWCEEVGLSGQFGSHTLRKTFCYTLYTKHSVPLELLMQILNHSSPRQTLQYICIQQEEIKQAYLNCVI